MIPYEDATTPDYAALPILGGLLYSLCIKRKHLFFLCYGQMTAEVAGRVASWDDFPGSGLHVTGKEAGSVGFSPVVGRAEQVNCLGFLPVDYEECMCVCVLCVLVEGC